jgi:GT2 family glycosyltransferase
MTGWRGCAIAAYLDRRIGTVTPFSNNATICSYPRFCADNPLPGDWSVAALDALFSRCNRGELADIPTAVGFCMYIRRDCLNEVGGFDERHFGKGYGEENDFSMRAKALGWRHALSADVFVYHAGSVSFADHQNHQKRRGVDTVSRYIPTMNLWCIGISLKTRPGLSGSGRIWPG